MVTPTRSASIESKKGSNATTCMPKPWRQIWAMVRPMNPKPMMVSVFPLSSESLGGVCITRRASTFFVCVGQAIGVGDPSAQRQHQSHGMFGHRGRIGPHRVDHQNPELGGGRHVDLVGAGGADEDDLEQGRPLAASPPSPGGAHRDRWRAAHGPRRDTRPTLPSPPRPAVRSDRCRRARWRARPRRGRRSPRCRRRPATTRQRRGGAERWE